jgi:chemotaxis protein methyltransferase CheR
MFLKNPILPEMLSVMQFESLGVKIRIVLLRLLMDDQQFLQLLNRFGLSWEGYRKVRRGVKKRIVRHMQQLGCRGVEEYLSALEQNPELRRQAECLLTVSISRFFRDLNLWQTLERQVLPAVIVQGSETVKVWSAGCARGEEAYSFRIVWERLRERFERLPEPELWATDIHPAVLEMARAGIYPVSSLKQVPEPWRVAYFTAVNQSTYAVKDFLKQGIVWKVHDLLSDDPPQRGFHIIFLRNNLLTYYQRALQSAALDRVLQCLAPGGFLITGAHEKVDCEFLRLLPFSHDPHVFQKPEQFPVEGPNFPPLGKA